MKQPLWFSLSDTIQAYIFFCSTETVTEFPVNIACKVKTCIINETAWNLS